MESREQKLRASLQLARELGQDAEIIRQVEAGEAHPVMLAFGLWRDDEDMANLTGEIYANRERQGSRAAPEP